MTLYLDSASLDDARTAAALRFIRGATTNPTLLARAAASGPDAIPAICDVLRGTVFYQLAADTPDAREREARSMAALRPGRIGLKIPCTLENLALGTRLADEGLIVGVTAVFSAAQVHLAIEAGARYVLPYVNRSTRLQGDGLRLVSAMRGIIDAAASPVEIIAASIKTPEEAVATLLAGAHHLTVPLGVIEAMAAHPLSEEAIAAFARDA